MTMNTDSFPLNLQRLSLEGQREDRTEGRNPKTELLGELEKQLLERKKKSMYSYKAPKQTHLGTSI